MVREQLVPPGAKPRQINVGEVETRDLRAPVGEIEILHVQNVSADFHAANQTPIGLALRAAQRVYPRKGARSRPSTFGGTAAAVDAAVAIRAAVRRRNGRWVEDVRLPSSPQSGRPA